MTILGHMIGAGERKGVPSFYPDWVIDAACRGVDPEIFFPKSNRRAAMPAKKVCADCPVRLQCLKDNLLVPFGIFGGLTERERYQLARKMEDPHKEGLRFFTDRYSSMVKESKRAG